ncbi:cysteine-tryptophan domain-containing zinc finger protein 7 isoform X3 [Nicotiana tomentosiformis]|uniref:cysteine-tryptophan domain-containing zinc finger protein 7 isoform X3 n=1 Tax=Nicotiana tomentosiformis TaxID=4098 RepID=UPI00051BA970|nr:uncharacterized protein LOC104099806 isoform X3 [Nicotiana tomentosiformis]
MIYVDGRKGLVLEFGVKTEMKETKLEEGDACNDSTVDPDIALSYIDEKLQDVLGHFQKDFEDGVSSENLGSKFGGYGSFLPTYQRSPSWSCTPSNMRPEGGRRSSVASSSTSLPGRPTAASAYSAVVPAPKAQTANGKTNSAIPPAHENVSALKSEIVKKPTNLSDQKAPKLHIGVGIENLSTQKKAEIYSGLGLDAFPSSSPDDSSIYGEGLSHDLGDSRYESPTSILQIMTSYPMHEGLLLSPLSDDLICLTEKGRFWGKCGSERMIKESFETSVALVNGSHYAKRKASEAGKWKSYDKDVLANGYGNDNQNRSGVQSKEEVDVDVITSEELVSKALKLPLIETKFHGVQSTEVLKEVSIADSMESKSKKTPYRDTRLSGSGSEDMKKNHAGDRYRDFFGDMEADDDNDETGVHEIPSPDSDAVGKKSLVEHNGSIKERVNVRKTEKPCSSGEYPISASNGSTSPDALRASQENQNLGVQVIESSRTKGYGSKASSSGTKQDCSQSSDHVIMNHEEKRRRKNKEKRIFLDNHSDGGTKNAKMRNMSEEDLDVSAKKIKRDDVHRESDRLRQTSQYVCKTENSDQGSDKERKNDHQYQNSAPASNGRRGSSSRNKDKNGAPKYDSDQCMTKDRDILSLSSDQMPLDEEKMTPGKNKFQEKSGVSSDRLKKSSKKDPSGKLLDKNVKGDNQSRIVHHDDAQVGLDVTSYPDKRHAPVPDRDDHRSSKKHVSNKSEQIEVSPKSPLTRDQNETVVFKEPVPGSERENGANLVIVDAFERERSNNSRQGKKAKSHHGKLPNSTAHKVRDVDVPSPVRKDSSSQAATNAIKEATNLKHLADRLKNSGSSESTGIYFQAALKFLHGASLLELDSTKHGELNQSRRIYSSTAKLCQFCAYEYEKMKDMAAAALAYKCMEVAYMRVIYSSQSDANRYRNELQTALQILPPGESPFSSVSDVDNLNNPTMVDKAALAKVVGSPQVAGTHVVSARNGSSFMRLINLAQEVNFAMEASRKSRGAYAAVNPGPGDSQCKEGALSVKRALDYNFQDVDGLLRLVRVAMEAISH